MTVVTETPVPAPAAPAMAAVVPGQRGAPGTAATARAAKGAGRPAALSHGVRRITLDADGLPLTALLREPDGPPRAVVVALHGAGMSAGYFDGQAHPGVSLLTLGASLGFTVLAVDRPGYGGSAAALPDGLSLREQARALRAALDSFAADHPTGAGYLLLAHSFGGKLALATAAEEDGGRGLLGMDISGCGHRYAAGPAALAHRGGPGHVKRNWGMLRLYPPDTFTASGALVRPMPVREVRDAEVWPEAFAALAARVRVPVRFTFAEYEAWWRHDEETLAELRTLLPAAPRVLVERQHAAGHNISLGWAARSYHLRALGFAEDCLLGVAG